LRDDRFEDFVADGGKDPFVVVLAEVLGGRLERGGEREGRVGVPDRSWVIAGLPVGGGRGALSSPSGDPCCRSWWRCSVAWYVRRR
jgi:hypothetical protein